MVCHREEHGQFVYTIDFSYKREVLVLGAQINMMIGVNGIYFSSELFLFKNSVIRGFGGRRSYEISHVGD